MLGRRRLVLVGGLVAVALVAVGVGYAAIPNGNTIDGCYGKIGGILRVIDTSKNQKCSSLLEVPISWNQTGAQGAKGDKGDPGINGTDGAPGAPGARSAGCARSTGGPRGFNGYLRDQW